MQLRYPVGRNAILGKALVELLHGRAALREILGDVFGLFRVHHAQRAHAQQPLLLRRVSIGNQLWHFEPCRGRFQVAPELRITFGKDPDAHGLPVGLEVHIARNVFGDELAGLVDEPRLHDGLVTVAFFPGG